MNESRLTGIVPVKKQRVSLPPGLNLCPDVELCIKSRYGSNLLMGLEARREGHSSGMILLRGLVPQRVIEASDTLANLLRSSEISAKMRTNRVMTIELALVPDGLLMADLDLVNDSLARLLCRGPRMQDLLA